MIGIVGYGNNSGTGYLISNLKAMLPEIKGQFIVKHLVKDKVKNVVPAEFDYFGKSDREIPLDEFKKWFGVFRPRIMIFIETPFNWDLLPFLKQQDCKIIFMPMLDSLPLDRVKYKECVSYWVVYNRWSLEILRSNKIFNSVGLGAPVNTEYLKFKVRGDKSSNFLHCGGYLGVAGRKGTKEVIEAFNKFSSDCGYGRLRIFSQTQIPFECSDKIEVMVADIENQNELYDWGDIYLAPSKREGIGYPILEAMACGFPVITSDWPPMNEYVNCPDCLVKTKPGRFGADIDVDDLIYKMQKATLKDLTEISQHNRLLVEKNCSYEATEHIYRKLFKEVLGGK